MVQKIEQREEVVVAVWKRGEGGERGSGATGQEWEGKGHKVNAGGNVE